MKRVESIEFVGSLILVDDQQLLLLLKKNINTENLRHNYIKDENGTPIVGERYINQVGNFVLTQAGDSPEVDVSDKSGNYVKKISGNFNLWSLKRDINSTFLIGNRNTKTYWTINENLDLINLNQYFHILQIIGGKYLLWNNRNVISKPFLSNNPIWEADMGSIGEYIKMNWEKALHNEIDGKLFFYNELCLLYVPLAGGQLVALNIEDGKIVWIAQTSYNGRYDIFKDKIYKVSDKLYEIDAKSGDILRQKEYSAITDKEFVPSGPVWAYSDILVLLDNFWAKVAVLDRESLELIEFIHIENVPGIAHSRDVIAWANNKLYIHDQNRTLHIFEK